MDAILVLNSGSSSIKFAAFERIAAPATLNLIGKGHIKQVGSEVELRIKSADGGLLEQSRGKMTDGTFDHGKAMGRMFAWLGEHRGGLNLAAVGHRVVHGGQWYSAPVMVTDEVLDDLDALVPLAPLHQPHNLKAIRFLREQLPAVPQVACFDTAFHIKQPQVAQTFALPRAITVAGVRRYGFHGLSYEYIASQLPRILGDQAQGKVIVAHLGSGASLCAIKDGKSMATTMGFSVLEGLMMGTRCGSLDPGVVLYMMQALRMTSGQISDMLYNQSGLLGVSGISNDMQVLLASDDPRAAEAIDLFVHRITCEIGSLAAAMGGLDALVFTAGIGEHAAPIRSRVGRACAWLGAVIDEEANTAGRELIHATWSALPVAVIPTDEEKMIATHTLRCARKASTVSVAGSLSSAAVQARGDASVAASIQR
jgi:acetate kinase